MRAVMHVPHASAVIPAGLRDQFVLNEDDLQREVRVMTDRRNEVADASTKCDLRPAQEATSQESAPASTPPRSAASPSMTCNGA